MDVVGRPAWRVAADAIGRCHVSNGGAHDRAGRPGGGHRLSGRSVDLCGVADGGALRDARQPGLPGRRGRLEDQARGLVPLHGFLHARETQGGLRARGGGQPAPGARHLSGLRCRHARGRRTPRLGRRRRGRRVGGAHAPLRSVGAARQHRFGRGASGPTWRAPSRTRCWRAIAGPLAAGSAGGAAPIGRLATTLSDRWRA